MAAFSSVPTKSSGDPYVLAMWNTYVRDNLNKLGDRMHRVVTVAAFAALTPEDGDEVYLEVDSTNGIYWHLRYRSASGSSYKWEFLGGPALASAIATSETTASTSYVDLSTAGPSVVAPRAGEYEIVLGALIRVNTGNASNGQYAGYAAAKLGSASTSDADAVLLLAECATESQTNVERTFPATLAASDTVKVQYKASAGTMGAIYRRVSIRPVRIS